MSDKYKNIDELLEHYKVEGLDIGDFKDSLNKTLAESHVPKNVFNERNEAYKSGQARIEELEKSNKDMAEWKVKYDELSANSQKEAEKYRSELLDAKRNFAIDTELAYAKVRNVKATRAMLDMSKVQYDEEGLHGLKEQLDGLHEKESWLFEASTQNTPFSKPKANGNGNPTFEDSLRKAMLGY